MSCPRIGSVGVLLRPDTDASAALAAVGRWAQGRGVCALVARGSNGMRLPAGLASAPIDVLARTDLLLALGGDGTVLRAMRLGASRGTPVLPVHLGHLGYLADVHISELDNALDDLGHGRYVVEEHETLAVEGASAQPTFALNDVVLRRGSAGRPARFALHIAEELFMRYSGDGLIVATPMGSTAYSFSAGGPIVSPGLAAMIVAPLAAHAPASRPLVLSVNDRARIEVLPSSTGLSVEIDGVDHGTVAAGGCVRVGPSAVSGRLIRTGGVGFASRARRKLQIADSPDLRQIT